MRGCTSPSNRQTHFFGKKIVRKNRELEVAPLVSLRSEKKRDEDRFCSEHRYSSSLTASSLGTAISVSVLR